MPGRKVTYSEIQPTSPVLNDEWRKISDLSRRRWDGVAWRLLYPTGGAILWIGKTQVYNGLSPAAWAALDLSGFESLGANKALVMLAFSSALDMNALAVRAKGDASQYFDIAVEANAYGVAIGHHNADADMVLLCTTDASGIMQWATETQQAAVVSLLAYIK